MWINIEAVLNMSFFLYMYRYVYITISKYAIIYYQILSCSLRPLTWWRNSSLGHLIFVAI